MIFVSLFGFTLHLTSGIAQQQQQWQNQAPQHFHQQQSSQFQPSKSSTHGLGPPANFQNQHTNPQSTSWGNNVQHRSNQNPNQNEQLRHSNLVDYPFTVEFIDRKVQSSTNLKDKNLIDYPFTVEYVNNTNAGNSKPTFNNQRGYNGQASLPPIQASFQPGAQTRYRQQHHRQFQLMPPDQNAPNDWHIQNNQSPPKQLQQRQVQQIILPRPPQQNIKTQLQQNPRQIQTNPAGQQLQRQQNLQDAPVPSYSNGNNLRDHIANSLRKSRGSR